MEHSHLVIILRTLSKKEIRELRKWLLSPAHNQREDVIELFEYLFAGAHLENDKFLQKERVFSKLFPDESYDDGKLRQTIHFLLKAVEEFLIYQELREDEVRSRMGLASVYRKRKLEKAFQKTMRGVEQTQENQSFRDEHYLRNEYLLQKEQYRFFEEGKRNVKMNLQEVSDALDQTYFADKLRQSCLMLSHQAVFKAGYKIELLAEILSHIESNPKLLSAPAIAIYYYIYRSFTEKENPEHFSNLKVQVQRNGHLFTSSEHRDIYLMAINYCAAKINSGIEQYIREAFDLYRRGFEIGVLIENQTISRWTFRNVVVLGLTIGEFDWVWSFIHDYQPYLHERYRSDMVGYCLAKYHHERKEYDQAMQHLVQVDSDDILLNLNARALLMQIYYEEEEFDALESLLDSTRMYVQRKEVMGYHKANFNNLIRYLRKLLRVNPFNKKEREKLQDEISQAKPMTSKDRDWLLEQLATL